MAEKRTRSAALIAAQKRYVEKNQAAKAHTRKKSAAKRFILKDASLEELELVKGWLRERENSQKKNG